MPVEYLQYLPDSPEFHQHTISNGPYRIETYNVILPPAGAEFADFIYLVINLVEPNNNGALRNLKVREALAWAVDKMALVQDVQDRGGPRVASPARQTVMQGVAGYQSGGIILRLLEIEEIQSEHDYLDPELEITSNFHENIQSDH